MNRFVLAFLVVFLLGCQPPIKNGTVYYKAYYPPWDEEVNNPIKVGEIEIPVYSTEHHPASYALDIKNNDNDKNETRTRRIWVNDKYWESVKEGDWIEVK